MPERGECATEREMGGNVGWVKLRRDFQMFHGFLNVAALHEDFVSEAVPTKKTLRVLFNHLTKRVNIHRGFPIKGRLVPVPGGSYHCRDPIG